MRYRKCQFERKINPEFMVVNRGCHFCGKEIKEDEPYFETTEGWGVDIISICEECFLKETN